MKLPRTKKGAIAITTEMIYTLAVIIVLFAVAGMWLYTLNTESPAQICRTTRVMSEASRIGPFDRVLDYKCDRYDIEIGAADVTSRGKVRETKVLGEVAETIRVCNWQTSEGLVDPFERHSGSTVGKSSMSCFPCATIKFDDKIASEISTPLNLLDYMTNTNMEGIDITYIDYITKNRDIEQYRDNLKDALSDQSFFSLKNEYDKDVNFYLIDDLDPNHDYYVLEILKHINTEDSTTGTVGGTDVEFTSAIIFVKVDDLQSLPCDYLES